MPRRKRHLDPLGSPGKHVQITHLSDARNPVCREELMRLHEAVDRALATLRVPTHVGGRGAEGAREWAETVERLTCAALDQQPVRPDRDAVLVQLLEQGRRKVERLAALHVAYQDARGDSQLELDRQRSRVHRRDEQLSEQRRQIKALTRHNRRLRERLADVEAHQTHDPLPAEPDAHEHEPEVDEYEEQRARDEACRARVLAAVDASIAQGALESLASELANVRGDADRMWSRAVRALQDQLRDKQRALERAEGERDANAQRAEQVRHANQLFRNEIDKLRGELRSSLTRARIVALEEQVSSLELSAAEHEARVKGIKASEQAARDHAHALEADYQGVLRRERELLAQVSALQAECQHRAEAQADAERSAQEAAATLRKAQGATGAPMGDLRNALEDLHATALENSIYLRTGAHNLTEAAASHLIDQISLGTLPKRDRGKYRELQTDATNLLPRVKFLVGHLRHPRASTISSALVMGRFEDLRLVDQLLLASAAVFGCAVPPKPEPGKAPPPLIIFRDSPSPGAGSSRRLLDSPAAAGAAEPEPEPAPAPEPDSDSYPSYEEPDEPSEPDEPPPPGPSDETDSDFTDTSADTSRVATPEEQPGGRRSISMAHTVRQRRRRVAHHPRSRASSTHGVERFEVVLQTIGQIYDGKLKADATDDRAGLPHKTMRAFCHEFMERRYGLKKIAKGHMEGLAKAVGRYGPKSARVRVFGRFNMWKTCCGRARCAHDEHEAEPSAKALDMFLFVVHRVLPSKGFAEALGGSQCFATVKAVERAMAETLFYTKLKPDAAELREWMAAAAASTPPDPTTRQPRVDLDECMERMLPLFALEEAATGAAELQRSGVQAQVVLWPRLFDAVQTRLEGLQDWDGDTDDPRIAGVLEDKLRQFDGDSDGYLVHIEFEALLRALGVPADTDHAVIAQFNQALDLEEAYLSTPEGAAMRHKQQLAERRQAAAVPVIREGVAGVAAPAPAPLQRQESLIRGDSSPGLDPSGTGAPSPPAEPTESDVEHDEMELRVHVRTLAHALQHDFGALPQPPRRRLSVHSLLVDGGAGAGAVPPSPLGTPGASTRSLGSGRASRSTSRSSSPVGSRRSSRASRQASPHTGDLNPRRLSRALAGLAESMQGSMPTPLQFGRRL